MEKEKTNARKNKEQLNFVEVKPKQKNKSKSAPREDDGTSPAFSGGISGRHMQQKFQSVLSTQEIASCATVSSQEGDHRRPVTTALELIRIFLRKCAAHPEFGKQKQEDGTREENSMC